ncbi:ZIP zinc transporter-domain-containing protein [Podospora aff. communis PSN243]|uniref:ZIP zinc transporter-domain-containing protein n=1 Tax=Podospora aff. communis PSN243 TaxID=3040156 RepID=A0AAV9G4F2_9PEZI|nr:ZIP zinc transporter-domain-containing protein [Podospora aff. communis PSN243]
MAGEAGLLLPAAAAAARYIPDSCSMSTPTTPTRILTVRGVDNEASSTSNWGLHIASIFVILVGSLIGSLLPIMLARQGAAHVPGLKHAFFATKYMGTCVIIGTAWMHLLTPAEDALRDPLLEPVLHGYDFAMAIALMTVLVMFFIELSVARLQSHHAQPQVVLVSEVLPIHPSDHLSHDQSHREPTCYPSLAAQMTAVSILEFGVLHSIFIGLALAVADADEFILLFVVIVVHQAFEGLGIGSRLATLAWPRSRWWVPWLFAALYGTSTPLAMAVGLLGVREKLQPGLLRFKHERTPPPPLCLIRPVPAANGNSRLNEWYLAAKHERGGLVGEWRVGCLAA